MRPHLLQVAFTLLLFISGGRTQNYFVKKKIPADFVGYRCGLTFFPRKFLFDAAVDAAHKKSENDGRDPLKTFNLFPKPYGGLYDFGGERNVDVSIWPIQNPVPSGMAHDQAKYFLVLGLKFQPVGVVYTPSGQVDVMLKCEMVNEVSNIRDINDFTVTGFRCPYHTLSFSDINSALPKNFRSKARRVPNHGLIMKKIFNYSERPSPLPIKVIQLTSNYHPDYFSRDSSSLPSMWPIGDESSVLSQGSTFAVLGKYGQELGIVQANKLLKSTTYVKCKLTANLYALPEFIESNHQQTPKHIGPDEMDVFQCNGDFIPSSLVLEFAYKASANFRQQINNINTRKILSYPAVFERASSLGSENIFLYPITFPSTSRHPLSLIFKSETTYLVLDDFSDIYGVIQFSGQDEIKYCERRATHRDLYREFYEDLVVKSRVKENSVLKSIKRYAESFF
ncbi:hypothetical protein K3495_g10986 [Podosphaera aphanis]|nr:hypothetical protein K3495_g10986 [Podosphaera aphanis]